MCGQEPDEFLLDGSANLRSMYAVDRQSFEDQPVDVEIDLHATLPARPVPWNSSSLMTLPSLRNSDRAESKINNVVILSPECAAWNAAFNAMPDMLPPVRLRRERRSKSRLCVGVCGGKAFS